MSDRVRQGRGRELARDMGMTDDAVERRKRAVGLGSSDVRRIASARGLVVRQLDELVASFFEHLSAANEARRLMANRSLVGRAKDLKAEHLLAMVGGEYGVEYAVQRLELAALYASAGLEPSVFVGAFHHMLVGIGRAIMNRTRKPPSEDYECFASLTKVAFFDIGLVVDAIVFERERVILQPAELSRSA